jgi:hypothetical protein
MTSFAHRMSNARITEMPATQVFLVILTIADIAFPRTTRIVAPMHCPVTYPCATRPLASVRQHFLKLDAVFSSVLVYSGWSASRFPSARSDQMISKLGGQYGQES